MSGHATGGDYSPIVMSPAEQFPTASLAHLSNPAPSSQFWRSADRELTRLPKHSPTRHSLNRGNPDFVISPY